MMHRVSAVAFVALLLAVSLVAAQPTWINVDDGGFEKNVSNNAISNEWIVTPGGNEVTLSTAVSFSGVASALLNFSGASTASIAQVSSIFITGDNPTDNANVAFRRILSFWYSGNVSAPSTISVDAAGVVANFDWPTDFDEWHFAHVDLSTITTPGNYSLTITANAAGAGYLYIDDVVIAGPHGTPIWQNPAIMMPSIVRNNDSNGNPVPQPAPNVGNLDELGGACNFPSPATTEYEDHDQYNEPVGCRGPPVYFGNTFSITGIVPANRTEAGSWPLVFDYFNLASLPTAANGYNMLLRVIAVQRKTMIGNGTAPTPLPPGIECPGGGYTHNCYNQVFQVLSSTGQPYVSWTILGNDTSGLPQFPIPIVNLTDSTQWKSFNFWANNPSALPWVNPSSTAWNASGLPIFTGASPQYLPSTYSTNSSTQALNGTQESVYANVELRWQIACQLPGGGDCGFLDQANPTATAASWCGRDSVTTAHNSYPYPFTMSGFGHWWDSALSLCWQDVVPPRGNHSVIGQPRTLDRIKTSLRPLSLFSPATSGTNFVMPGIDDDGKNDELVVKMFPGLPSPNVLVALPVAVGTTATINPQDVGSALRPYPLRFTPGRDNSGGSLTITVQSVWQIWQNASIPPSLVSTIQMTPSSVTLTAASPAASFRFPVVPQPPGLDSYRVYFQVTESATNSSVLSTGFDTSDGVGAYNNFAYAIPTLRLTFEPAKAVFLNVPWNPLAPVQLPIITTASASSCSNPSQLFSVGLSKIPNDMGLTSVTFPFTLSTPGLQLWQCGTTSKRQDTATQISAFTFGQFQDTINFIVTTPATIPTPNDMWIRFGTASTTPAGVVDVEAAFAIGGTGNATYHFSLVPNQVVQLQAALSDGSPYVYEPFYWQVSWTPPTVAGFQIQISGLYTTWPDGVQVQNSGSIATFPVPAGSTSIVIGPMRVSAPSNLPLGSTDFSLPYTFALIAAGSTSSDNTWYSVGTAVQLATFKLHKFVLANDVSGMYLTKSLGVFGVPGNGQKTPPICIALTSTLAFAQGASDTLGLWLTPIVGDSNNGDSLLLEPVNPPPSSLVQPANSSMYFSPSSTVQCFTVRIDLPRAVVSATVNDHVVEWWTSGPLANQFQDKVGIANLPGTFRVRPLTLSTNIINADKNFLIYGETSTILVQLDQSPPRGLNYTLIMPGVTLEPITAGAGYFAPGSSGTALVHAWSATFNQMLPNIGYGAGQKLDAYYGSNMLTRTGLEVAVSGADAALVVPVVSTEILLKGRTIYLSADTPTEATVAVGYSVYLGSVTLAQPAINGITVRPILTGNTMAGSVGTPSAGVVFTPASFTFTSSSQHTVAFWAVGQMLGTWNVQFQIDSSSPDASFFTWNAPSSNTAGVLASEGTQSPVIPVTVTTRNSISVSSVATVASVSAGVQYGPYTVAIPPQHPLIGDETVTVTLVGGDLTFSPSNTFTLTSAVQQAIFSVTWTPGATSHTDLLISYTTSGNAAWKYNVLAAGGDFSGGLSSAVDTAALTMTGQFRTFSWKLPTATCVAGVRYTGYIMIDPVWTIAGQSASTGDFVPPPQPITVTLTASSTQFFQVGSTTGSSLLPLTIGPTSGVAHFEFVVSPTNWNLSSPDTGANNIALTTNDKFTFYATLDPTSPGAVYFGGERAVQPTTAVSIVRRSILFDQTQQNGGKIKNTFLARNSANLPGLLTGKTAVFMLNHESPTYFLTLTMPPTSGPLSVTITHPLLQFSPATITFQPGQLSASFSFTPVALWPSFNDQDAFESMVNIALAGDDARLYEYSNVWSTLKNFLVIPEFGFSPIPAIYTDGAVEDLSVWLVNATSLFTQPDIQFVLHVVATSSPTTLTQQSNVFIQPSSFTFTQQSLTPNLMSQHFSIQHVRPAQFCPTYPDGTMNSYALKWRLRFEGKTNYPNQVIDITPWVPLDAQRVILSRYQIVPQFPGLLDFSWQEASFNLSRGPWGQVALIPHQAQEDGNAEKYGGSRTAGGRIVFDPAVITFAPGQKVQTFRVQAVPGNAQGQVYYRVQWHMEGHADDTCNYIDYAYPRADNGATDTTGFGEFATWHIAPASAMTSSVALVLVLCLLALFL